MSLRLSDAIRLSWGNVSQHKGRSLPVVLTIAVLFGLILGVNFVLQGLEDTVVVASVASTEETCYIQVRHFYYSISGMFHTMTEGEILDLGFVEQAESIEDVARKYGAERVGTATYFNDFQEVEVLNSDMVEKYMSVDYTKVPEGTVPALIPNGGFTIFGESVDEMLERVQKITGAKFYVVGEIPMADGWQSELSDWNPLDAILSTTMHPSGRLSFPVLIDDGSGVVKEYLRKRVDAHLQSRDEEFAEALSANPDMDGDEKEDLYTYLTEQSLQATRSIIFRFSDVREAIKYALQYDDISKNGIIVNDLFSNTISVARSFAGLKNMLVVLEIILLIVAVVIATLTFGHMIDQDAATIALYRAMGATKGEIMMIYFWYLLELCALALGVCIVIALGIAGMTALLNASELSVKLQEFYHLAEAPKVWFFALNWVTWTVVGAIFAIAPVTLILAERHFSARNIARKLKEE